MCEWKSAVVVKPQDGEKPKVLLSAWTDSHEDLVSIQNLRDVRDNLCRIEFKPGDDPFDLAGYRLRVDEEREPGWFAGVREYVEDRMRSYIKSLFIETDCSLLIGGEFLVRNCVVRTIKTCRVHSVSGSAKIDHVRGSAKIVKDERNKTKGN